MSALKKYFIERDWRLKSMGPGTVPPDPFNPVFESINTSTTQQSITDLEFSNDIIILSVVCILYFNGRILLLHKVHAILEQIFNDIKIKINIYRD